MLDQFVGRHGHKRGVLIAATLRHPVQCSRACLFSKYGSCAAVSSVNGQIFV